MSGQVCVWGPGKETDARWICGQINNRAVDFSQNVANARLIAAAPDLLASVKELVEWHARREGEGTEDALLPPEQQEAEMWRAMDAIAKAEGQ